LEPIRTASGDDMRVLLRSLDGLTSALTLAGQEIVRLSGQQDAVLLEMMRERLQEAKQAAARFRPQSGGDSCLRTAAPIPTTDQS
jgi:hypothetical protein